MKYSIIYDNSSLLKKDISDLKKNQQNAFRIKNKIEDFAANPLGFIGNIKKLQPKEDNVYRISVGEHRIILSIDYGNHIIIIHRIGLRKEVYK